MTTLSPSQPAVTTGPRPLSRPQLSPRSLAHQGALGGVALAGVLLVWWGFTSGSGLVSAMRFPSPQETWGAWTLILGEGYSSARWHAHVLRSVLLVLMGFTVAASCGVLVGLAMGASRRVEALLNPAISTNSTLRSTCACQRALL